MKTRGQVFASTSTSILRYCGTFSVRLSNFTSCASLVLWGGRNLSILKTTVLTSDSLSIYRIQFSDRVEAVEREIQTLLRLSLAQACI